MPALLGAKPLIDYTLLATNQQRMDAFISLLPRFDNRGLLIGTSYLDQISAGAAGQLIVESQALKAAIGSSPTPTPTPGPTPTPTPTPTPGSSGTLPDMTAASITLPVSGSPLTHRAQLVDALADTNNTVIAISGVLDIGTTNGGGAFEDNTVTINRDVTIIPAAGYGAREANPYGDSVQYARRFARQAQIRGWLKVVGGTFRMYGIKMALDTNPPPGESWPSIGIKDTDTTLITAYGTSNIDVQGCQFEGFGSTLDPYVAPSDATAAYNRYASGPGGIKTSASSDGLGNALWTGVSFTCRNNYFNGLSQAVTVNMAANATMLTIDSNEFARPFSDLLQIKPTNPGAVGIIDICRNVFLYPVSTSQDTGGPHADAIQLYVAGGSGLVRNIRIWGNLFYGAGRQPFQAIFFGGGTANVTTEGVKIAFNMVYGANKAIGGGYHKDPLWAFNTFCVIHGTASAVDNASMTKTRNAAVADSIGLIAGNMATTIASNSSGASFSAVESNNFALGSSPSTAAIEAAYAGPFGPITAGQIGTLNQIYNALKPKAGGGNEGKGVTSVFPTLKEFLEANAPTIQFASFPGVVNAAPSSIVESGWTYVHGPANGNVPVNPGLGVEWTSQTLDGTTIQNWTSSAGTAPSGSRVKIRASSSMLSPGATQYQITIGAFTTNWVITTASILKAPAFVPTANMRLVGTDTGGTTTRNGLTGVAASQLKFSGLFRFRVPGALQTGAVQSLLYVGTGANIDINLNSTANAVVFRMRNGATTLAGFSSGSVVPQTNAENEVLFSFDLTAPTDSDEPTSGAEAAANRLQLWLNGQPVTPTALTFQLGTALPGFDGLWALFSRNGGANPLLYQARMVALFPGVFIDWSDPQQRLWASTEYCGPNGEGITGTIPPVFSVGEISGINGSAANRGTGGNFGNLDDDVVVADAQPWPPNLQLVAEPRSGGVMRIKALGYPKPNVQITATGSVTGAKTGILSQERGGYVDITFNPGETVAVTNNGNYTNPANATAIA